MSEENISQEFTLENINKTRNDLIEEIIQNELRSQRHRKVYRVMNHFEQLLMLISTATGCVSISTFAF